MFATLHTKLPTAPLSLGLQNAVFITACPQPYPLTKEFVTLPEKGLRGYLFLFHWGVTYTDNKVHKSYVHILMKFYICIHPCNHHSDKIQDVIIFPSHKVHHAFSQTCSWTVCECKNIVCTLLFDFFNSTLCLWDSWMQLHDSVVHSFFAIE